MGKNSVLKKLTGSGIFTVPAEVKKLKIGSKKDMSSLTRITGGSGVMVMRRANSKWWGFGQNTGGQLGDGTSGTVYTSPVQAFGGMEFKQVAIGKFIFAGDGHSVLLKEDGSAWCTGLNDSGQLGDGTTANKSTPVQVLGGHKFVKVAAGSYHSMGLKADGSVWGWGNNGFGNLGINSQSDSYSSPVQAVGGHVFVDIACAGATSYGLKADGSVWACGENFNGQCGIGTSGSFDNQLTFVQMIGGHQFVKIAAGFNHFLGLKENGEIWGVGFNNAGALGVGDTNSYSSLVQMLGGHVFVDMACSASSSVMLDENGDAWACGNNNTGQLGDGTTSASSTPVQVLGGHKFVAVAFADSNFTTGLFTGFLKANGEVWVSGGNLGNGTPDTNSTPVQTAGPQLFGVVDAIEEGVVIEVEPGEQIPYNTGGDMPHFGLFVFPTAIGEIVLEYQA